MNNMIFGALYDEWETETTVNGKKVSMPNHADPDKLTKWLHDLRVKAMSSYFNFILPGEEAAENMYQADRFETGFRPDSGTIAKMTQGFMEVPNSAEFFGDGSIGQSGRGRFANIEAAHAYRDTVIKAMNNLHKSDSLHADDIITLPLLKTSENDTREATNERQRRFLEGWTNNETIKPFTNANFKLADTKAEDAPVAVKTKLKDGQPYLEQGGFIFAFTRDGDTVKVEVYDKDGTGVAEILDVINRGKNVNGNKAKTTRITF